MKEIVMIDSPDAASQQTLTLWVSRHGWAFADEKDARWDGATHKWCPVCETEAIVKNAKCCGSCRDILAEEKYLQLEKVQWDSKTPIYSNVFDEYFYAPDEVTDFLDFWEITHTAELRLVLCEPVYLPEIDESYWADELGEEGELPEEVAEALDRLNEAVRAAGPVSWMPGNKRVVI